MGDTTPLEKRTKAQLIAVIERLNREMQEMDERHMAGVRALAEQNTKQKQNFDSRVAERAEHHASILRRHQEDWSRQRAAYIRRADELLNGLEKAERDLIRSRIQVEALTTALVLVAEETRDGDDS